MINALLIAAAVVVIRVPAPCMSPVISLQEMVELLTEDGQYRELPLFQGSLGERQIPIRVFARMGGTWTMIALPTPVTACLVAVGQGFKPSPALSADGPVL